MRWYYLHQSIMWHMRRMMSRVCKWRNMRGTKYTPYDDGVPEWFGYFTWFGQCVAFAPKDRHQLVFMHEL
jgi:hypothetical protein